MKASNSEVATLSVRSASLDYLRILATFFVVTLHVLELGGVLHEAEVGTTQYVAIWLLETITLCAVNVFALLSGYLSGTSKIRFRFDKLFSIWCQIVLYNMVVNVIFIITGMGSLQVNDWIRSLLPFTFTEYWYLTAYCGVVLFMPVLNSAIYKISENQLKVFFMIVLIVYSMVPTVFGADPFLLSKGYSTLWLCILYIVGGGIRRLREHMKIKKTTLIIIYVLLVAITWGVKIIFDSHGIEVFGHSLKGDMLLSYTSPTILLISVVLLLLFTYLDLNDCKLITWLSSASLGVYIIHQNPIVGQYLLKGSTHGFASMNTFVMIILCILMALLICGICTVIDSIRLKIFEWVNVQWLYEKMEIQIRKTLNIIDTMMFSNTSEKY